MGMFSRNYERRSLLRGVLFFIIVATIPFYVIGLGLLILPSRGNAAPIASTPTSAPPTFTPLGGGGALPSLTPLRPIATSTGLSPLQPTPPQFIIPTRQPTAVVPPAFTFAPPLTPATFDRDGDGIPDVNDACPDQVGPARTNGCPDRDGDGIIDSLDQCPDLPGILQFSGCPAPTSTPVPPTATTPPTATSAPPTATPPPTATTIPTEAPPLDSDGDGIPDSSDLCPAVPGIPLLSGCPEPDSDGDGVPDASDLCPAQLGSAANNGCP